MVATPPLLRGPPRRGPRRDVRGRARRRPGALRVASVTVDVQALAARRKGAGRYVRTRHGLAVGDPQQTPGPGAGPRAAPAPQAQGRGAREAAQRPTLG